MPGGRFEAFDEGQQGAFFERLRRLSATTEASAMSMSDLAAALGVSADAVARNYTSSGSFTGTQVYTPDQLVEKLVKSVKSSDLDDDELRALVGEIITSVTNQLYEIIKERES